jgi:DNA-binding NarL/FixJ family response regulator
MLVIGQTASEVEVNREVAVSHHGAVRAPQFRDVATLPGSPPSVPGHSRRTDDSDASPPVSAKARRETSVPPAVLVASPTASLRTRCSEGLRGFVLREVDHRANLERTIVQLKPGVVFLDLALPGMGGLGGVPAIQRLHPDARVVVLASTPNERQAVFALVAGARGYCDRNISSSLIRKAAEVVQSGEIWIARGVVQFLLKRLSSLTKPDGAPPAEESANVFDPLAPRERQIAQLVASGANNKDIASRLRITEATVKAHLTSVFRKLNVSDRLRLALLVSAHKSRTASTN